MKYASNNVYFSKKMLLFSINWNLYHLLEISFHYFVNFDKIGNKILNRIIDDFSRKIFTATDSI